MQIVTATERLRTKYGSWSQKILRKVEALGPIIDSSKLTPDGLRDKIAQLPATESVCLVGGYDIVPTFFRPNPTQDKGDSDREIPTDNPYGATPGNLAQEYAPARAISRIPDGIPADPAAFLKVLSFQAKALSWATPAGSFEEASAEFDGAAGYVHKQIKGTMTADEKKKAPRPRLSPPDDIEDFALPSRIQQRGRVHILLHGTDASPDWAYLYGKSGTRFIEALSARVLDLCDLRGSMVTFSSCYSAMIDTGESEASGRSEANQVALACLGHGARVVIGSTRANWIQMDAPYSGHGPGVAGRYWKHLGQGTTAAEALRLAKRDLLTDVLKANTASVARELLPYTRKTLLQLQCYGHPEARL